MKLFIKNMVCQRCRIVVEQELEKLGLHYINVDIGMAEIFEPISIQQLKRFKIVLIDAGLELMDEQKSTVIEKIKKIILDYVLFSDQPLKVNFSFYLSEKLNLDYTYLANMFSASEGNTIESFLIMNKIDRVKQLISCNELTLTEISQKLHYSSVAHLSTQFKKVTGITPSSFKNIGNLTTLPSAMCEL